MTIRVLVVDDQALVRGGFAMVLSQEEDIQVVAEAGTGLAAIEQARLNHPDVILMDIRMPDLDGLEATARILTAADWPVRVLILTTFEPDEYIYQALRAGASGFVLKDIRPEELPAAIRTVAHGGALLAPSITRRLIGQFTRGLAADTTLVQPRGAASPTGNATSSSRWPAASATPRSPEATSSARRPSSHTSRTSRPSSTCGTGPSWSSSRTRAAWSRWASPKPPAELSERTGMRGPRVPKTRPPWLEE